MILTRRFYFKLGEEVEMKKCMIVIQYCIDNSQGSELEINQKEENPNVM